MGFPIYYLKLIEDIFDDLHTTYFGDRTHCFLCGSNNMDFRDKLKERIEGKGIKVIYAENLFEAIVHNKSKANHLDLEQMLASNVELIVIILESPGAMVELGMFSNNANEIKKLLVLMDDKYRMKESFINYGPIKKISDLDDIKRVFYYKADGDGVKELKEYQQKALSKTLDEFKDLSPVSEGDSGILGLISLYYLLQIMIFLFNPIDSRELIDLLMHLNERDGMGISREDITVNINSVLSWLLKEGYLEKDKGDEYKLTKEGIRTIGKELYSTFGTRTIDSYRVQFLNYRYRHSYKKVN
ncbi:MAG: retron St85 family effector protein [Tissierellaceae bacterium]